VAVSSRCIIETCGGSGTTRTPGAPRSADAISQLDQQRPRGFGDRGQVADGQQAGRVAGRAPGQAVQALEGPVLVPVQVAQRVVHDRPALAPVGVHAQHRLLGHRAAGQVDGGRLAEQPGDLGLELGDHAPSP